MKYVTIAILSGSMLVDEGMRATLMRFKGANVNYVPLTVENAAASIARLHPSIVLFNPALASVVPVETLRRQAPESTKLIALAVGATPPGVDNVFDATVGLYSTVDTIHDTIRKALETETDDTDRQEISPRERDVIIGIVKGLSNKEIAEHINVSVNTVMTHRRNIARKLQIHSPAALTVYAIVKKLVKLEDITPTF